ncbi:MAG: serine/threonine-protein kinase, partial [Steroidobacteraceae bacterium]
MRIGSRIGAYEVIAKLGEGGMGEVYRARDTKLGREVALKVLPDAVASDADRLARFEREAKTLAALNHPHIAHLYGFEQSGQTSAFVMELVEGEDLSQRLARGPIPVEEALPIAKQIAEALEAAHEQGIVHRDLKPANVMLTEDGHAKVIDFGLAKLIAPLTGDTGGETFARGAGTDPNVVMGTVSYMSPEQARGGVIDHRTDIFSFGVMLYEMLTGTLPFRGHSSIETIHAILHDPPQPLPRLAPALTVEAMGDIERILEKCLAKDPNARYQGMKDLVVDLRAARRRMDAPSTSRTMGPG